MFISKLILNSYRREAKILLSNPQKLHAAIMRSFSQEALDLTQNEGRPLWRLETDLRDPTLYVTSPVEPDFAHIVEIAGRQNDPYGVIIKNFSPILNLINNGTEFKFKAKLNPVKKSGSQKIPHITNFFQKEWLIKKSTSAGFQVVENKLAITNYNELNFKHNQSQKITLTYVTYVGLLKITDRQLFEKTLRFGFGSGKAYGLGLISIAKK